MTVAEAKADVLVKRARLKASVAEARYRLAPATIAANVTDDLRERTLTAAETGLEAVRQKPKVAAGVATGLLAFAMRRRIWRLFRKKPKAGSSSRPLPPIDPASSQEEFA